jgi:hypothetical protein
VAGHFSAPSPGAASLRDDTVKQKRVRVAIGASAIAAAAAVAMVLMLPRHRVAQAPAAAHNPARQSETAPAGLAQRTAPLAVSTGTVHRHAAERPARLEDATGAARAQTAQDAHMRNASAAPRPQDESKPQAENANAAEPPIEIAVPTENLFPPGAVPPGIGFTAVVTISEDDAAQSAGASPRFARISNGGNQP